MFADPVIPPLLFLPLLLLACLGYGRLWLPLLGSGPARDPWRALLAVAAGLGTVGHLVLAAGLLGALSKTVLGLIVAPGLLLGAHWLARGTREKRAEGGEPDPGRHERWLVWGLVGYLVVVMGMTLLSALKPVDGLDWDSLSYHLAAPKIYLREGRIFHIAYDSHTNFPFSLEMLYTLALAWSDDSGAKLIHWSTGGLTAAGLWVWVARLRVGGRSLPAWAGPLAGASFLSMPLVMWEMGTAYIDVGTALFQFLAFALVVDSVVFDDDAPGRPIRIDPGRVALAGVYTGFALGTKYTALLQFGLLGLILLWAMARARPAGRVSGARGTLLFGVAALVIAAPWYLKNWFWVHNPVYPFFFKFFPNSFSWTQLASTNYEAEQKSFGLRKEEATGFLWSLWDLGMHGRAFFVVAKSVVGDKLGSLGPIWAGILPLAFWARGVGWSAGCCWFYFGASMGMWWFLSQQNRYLMPVFAVAAVLVALIVAGLTSIALRRAAGLFLAGALALNLVVHLPLATDAFGVVTGAVSRDDYLRASLGSLHEASKFADTLPASSRIAFYQETRGYYFNRDYFWANPGQHNMIDYEALPDGAALVAELKRFRITHVLINLDFTAPGQYVDVPWYRRLTEAIEGGLLRPVFGSRGARYPDRGIIIYELR